MLTEDQIDGLMRLWDDLDAAIQRVETSLPTSLSDNVRKMSGERIAFRRRLQGLMRQAANNS